MLRYYSLLYYILSCTNVIKSVVEGAQAGMLLLYRPLDISNECAFSSRLRYDLSYGMGMSDTITMVFRTIKAIDYQCNIEVTAPLPDNFLIVVIKFPTNLQKNCDVNRDAFILMKRNKCLRLCDFLRDTNMLSFYFVMTVKERLRFRFISNSSINSEFNALMYQVTATTARKKVPKSVCRPGNETLCVVNQEEFCFTNGVVCDGIKNCGVRDWFDERQSECSLPVEYLGYAPVIALVAVIACALIAGGHILLRCLPPAASSFFIFNANEDNRLCIDPIMCPPENTSSNVETVKRVSLIPVVSSESTNASDLEEQARIPKQRTHSIIQPMEAKRGGVKTMTARIQEKIRIAARRGKLVRASAFDVRAEEI